MVKNFPKSQKNWSLLAEGPLLKRLTLIAANPENLFNMSRELIAGEHESQSQKYVKNVTKWLKPWKKRSSGGPKLLLHVKIFSFFSEMLSGLWWYKKPLDLLFSGHFKIFWRGSSGSRRTEAVVKDHDTSYHRIAQDWGRLKAVIIFFCAAALDASTWIHSKDPHFFFRAV